MKFNFIYVFIISFAIGALGCGSGTDAPANAKNTNVANANANQVSTNTTLEPIKKEVGATTNNAPTIGPVVQTYYQALRKKDDALLKSVMSDEFIKTIEADMKAENKKGSFAAFVAEVESDLDDPVEVRNEKIEGNNAVAELKGGVYLNWTPFAFVNEGGKWKFTGGSPALK